MKPAPVPLPPSGCRTKFPHGPPTLTHPLPSHPVPAGSATPWTLIELAAQPDSAERRAALEQFLLRYLPAMRSYLLRRCGGDAHQCDDLVQSFIARKVLEQAFLQQADRAKGRFRGFLRTALEHFFIDEMRRKRLPRARAELDQLTPTATPAAHSFDVAWARTVLETAQTRMRLQCQQDQRPDLWRLFEERVLKPILSDMPPLAYAQLVQELGLESPSQACNLLVTAKRMFERHLRAVVEEYAGNPAAVAEELRDLREILSQAAQD